MTIPERGRPALFALWVVFLFGAAAPAAAEEPRKSSFRNFLDDGGAVFSMPFRKENRKITLGIVAAVGTASLFDNAFQKHLYPDRGKETPDEFRQGGDLLEFAGLAYGSVVGLRGVITGDDAGKREALLAYETYIWAAAALGSMKWVTGRRRPAESGNPFRFVPKEHGSSFPSGHTTQAFAAATLISERYRRWSVTVPAYLAASSVGVSRALANKHWASDVVAGAALGTAVAHLLRRRNYERMNDAAWRLEPDGDGIRLVRSF